MTAAGLFWSARLSASLLKNSKKFSEESLETPRRNSLTTNYFSTEFKIQLLHKAITADQDSQMFTDLRKNKVETKFLKRVKTLKEIFWIAGSK